ncbi:MAG: dihydropteroate synthase [Acidobacteria bacterium]|nr:dihydropteroate synthase [Acidobacteriota bacterium]
MITKAKRYTLSLPNKTLTLGEKTLVMGILNITPDSFSDGGKFLNTEKAISRALEIELEGADILDIGAESSRPNAEPVSLAEELKRVLPVIEGLKGILKIPISIDTYKAEVAKEALAKGAELVNDISALRFDENMGRVVADFGAALCLMHMRGSPKNMQQLPFSNNILEEIQKDLAFAIEQAENLGINSSQIILDPGIGFGKNLTDNLKILANLSFLEKFNLPILIGTSRKSFIGQILNNLESDRLMGTAASVTAAILQGVHIIRVHDVAQMVEVAKITDAIANQNNEI